jgi:cytochrome c oxidase cbb3-type subunit I
MSVVDATLNPAMTAARQDVGDQAERSMIDASCRGPVLYAFGSAVFWLIVGTLFALLTSYKFDAPGFLEHLSFLTFGRVRSAHLNAVIYGWASLAAVGTSVWLMARLCRAKLQGGFIVNLGITLWNLAVAVGLCGILAGDMTSIEWLEFPRYATPLLFCAFALIAIWVILMFTKRAPGHVYVSQWYLLAAFLSFPWLYATVQLLLIFKPVQGSVVGIVNWWYAHNVLGLWFTPVGLAAAYYFIPKVLGKPVYSYYLSIVGFWTLVFFYNWAGIHHLIGGPVPAWLVTASTVGSVMMTIPVVTVAINHHMTMNGSWEALRYSPTLRFIIFGAMSYTLVSLQGVSMSIQSLNVLTHFTHYTIGHAHIGMYAFFTMMMFGSIYYIVPRLINWEWPSATLIRIHFWCTALGIILMVLTLQSGGLLQGLALLDEKVPFMATVDMMRPFLVLRTWSGMLMFVGHMAFGILFVMMILRLGKKSATATLLEPVEVRG